MKRLLLSGLFVLFAGLPVRANVWKDVGSDPDGTFAQIDTDSIITKNGSYEYNLFLFDVSRSQIFFAREQMLCNQRQTRVLTVSTLDRGQVITENSISDEKFQPILVDSMHATIYKLICK